MTNREKIRELTRKHQGTMTDAQYLSMFNAIEEMAEWKDKQHKQELIRIYNFVNPYLTPEANKDLKILIGLH